MHLISCDNCATVFDQSKLSFAEDIEAEDGSIDDSKASWSQKTRSWVAFVPCPVCERPLEKEEV